MKFSCTPNLIAIWVDPNDVSSTVDLAWSWCTMVYNVNYSNFCIRFGTGKVQHLKPSCSAVEIPMWVTWTLIIGQPKLDMSVKGLGSVHEKIDVWTVEGLLCGQ